MVHRSIHEGHIHCLENHVSLEIASVLARTMHNWKTRIFPPTYSYSWLSYSPLSDTQSLPYITFFWQRSSEATHIGSVWKTMLSYEIFFLIQGSWLHRIDTGHISSRGNIDYIGSALFALASRPKMLQVQVQVQDVASIEALSSGRGWDSSRMGWDCGLLYIFMIRGRRVAMTDLTGMELLGFCKFIMVEREVCGTRW